jgi:hypothetical protein
MLPYVNLAKAVDCKDPEMLMEVLTDNNIHLQWKDKSVGVLGLFASNVIIFNWFLSSKCEYLVILEDDAMMSKNFDSLLKKYYLDEKHYPHQSQEWTKRSFQSRRLGQATTGMVYDQKTVKNIFKLINTYGVWAGIDHLYSCIDLKSHPDQELISAMPEEMLSAGGHVGLASPIPYCHQEFEFQHEDRENYMLLVGRFPQHEARYSQVGEYKNCNTGYGGEHFLGKDKRKIKQITGFPPYEIKYHDDS